MRAAIYARYSSDRQQDRSIDDQLALCRDHAARAGYDVVEVYADHAISGASALNRPGLQKLLADARQRRFDAVIAEALDRLSRDQGDTAGIFKRLRHVDVAIVTVAEGAVGELHVGLKGTMNALFLRDLAQKVRRGLRGRALEGLAACGISYGYARVAKLDDRGEPVRGLRRIEEGEASVVRRIFSEYVAGRSPRAIAATLNREGIASPRGGQWNASTINGNRARRNGILHNELYVGFVVWNRQTFRKDPDTGRRVARLNPTAEWIVVEAPHLRIIDAETWEQAQAMKARHAGHAVHVRRRPKKLLSGLVRCGICGGGCTILTKDRFGCSAAREKGTCDNKRMLAYADLELLVLDGLKAHLMAPDIVAEYVRTYHAGMKARRQEEERRRAGAAEELTEVRRRITNLVDLAADGRAPVGVLDRLRDLEERKAGLEQRVGGMAAPSVVELHPNVPALYARKVEALQAALNADDRRRLQATEILRSLIDGIAVEPDESERGMKVTIYGRLAEILNLARLVRPSEVGTAMVVAGTRIVQCSPDVVVIVLRTACR